MNRQSIVYGIIGFVIGMALVSFLKSKQQNNDTKIATEAAKVMSNVANQYIDGYYKLNDQRLELFELAKSYEETKSSTEKAKIADALVRRIRDFNFPVIK